MSQRSHAFLRNRSGGLTAWFALLLPALAGVAALAMDIGRIYTLENDLQTAADSYARAAAFELDGRPGAIARATQAANTLIANDHRFGQGGSSSIGVGSLRFFSNLPSSDTAELGSSYETNNDVNARYLELTVSPESVSTILPVDMISGVLTLQLDAKAVAGSEQGVCSMTPLFICNPFEGSGTSIFDVADDRSFQRRQLLLFEKGGGKHSQYFPGNYGYLQTGGPGANELKEAMASSSPNTCYSRAGVELRTGAVASVVDGFNTRFDIYSGSYKNDRNDPNYAPAENVIRGVSGAACKESDDANAMGLPRDECHLNDSCTMAGGRLGDGSWDLPTYLEVNHGAPTSIIIGSETYSINYSSRTVSPELPTRYEIYRWEIDTGRIPGSSGYGASTTPENGVPQCYSGGSLAPVDRRVVRVAVLDCLALDSQYGINGSSAPPLPVTAFWKVFITEPIESKSNSQIWGEMVGPVVAGEDSLAVETARLMR